jgi:hypothetical protein
MPYNPQREHRMNLLDNHNQRFGLALVGLGLLILFFRFFSWVIGWPLFILIPGVALLSVAAFGGRAASALFIPGSILTTLGSIFFVQNATDYFESWAYVWTLIPASVGVGLMLLGERSGNPQLVGQGRRLAGIFAAIFVVALIFFEAFIFGDLLGTWLFRTALPLILIAAGAFLLFQERGGVSSGE